MSHDLDEKPIWPAGEDVDTCLTEIHKSAALFKDLMELCAAAGDDTEALMNSKHETWWKLSDVAGDMVDRIAALQEHLPIRTMSWKPDTEPSPDAKHGGAR